MNRVAWVEVTCTAPGPTRTAARRTLLVNASGYACSGNGSNGGIVAVMGASGSGKTTLLTLLAGHAQADAGSIKLNGGPLRSSSVGFLPQFDFLFESLTVLETLRLGSSLRGARLSPSAAAADEQDDARLLALLTRLGLAHVVHSRIGQANAAGKRRGISGGERKRCALALALLDAPPLLVLDEPTSGLDARAAVDVLRVLSTLTAEQAVVISLHQPSARAFGLVSQLMLLTPGGRTLFFGAPSRALEHFASLGRPVPSYTNPAEHYIELAADSDDQGLQALLLGAADAAATGQSLARALLETRRGAQDGAVEGAQDGAAASAPPPRRSRRSNTRLQRVSYDDVALDDVAPTPATPERRASVSFVAQLRALHWRATTQNRRHPAFMRAMASRSVMMAFIVGHLYSGLGTSQASVQDRTGVLYFVLANQIMSASGSIRTFVAERDIAAHELRAHLYRLPAYFAARSLAEATLHLGFALLFGLLTYALVGLAPTAEQLGVFLTIVALVTLCAESIVVLVGAAMPDERSAAVVGPVVLALFMVCGGLFVNAKSMPTLFRLFNLANPFSYAFAALLQNEMRNLTLSCEPHELIGLPPPETASLKAAAALLGDLWPAQRCPTHTGEEVIERMALGGWSASQNAAALVLMIVVYRALAFAALRARFKRL